MPGTKTRFMVSMFIEPQAGLSALNIYEALRFGYMPAFFLGSQVLVLLADTLFATLSFSLMASRLYFIRWRLCQLMTENYPPTSGAYTNIIAILTESYALRMIFSIPHFAAFMYQNMPRPMLAVMYVMDEHAKKIAYLLVLYRVLAKRAWEGETETRLTNTSLRWNRELDATVGFLASPPSGGKLSKSAILSRISEPETARASENETERRGDQLSSA
ncbi:hypothetical protein NP233_g3791 [Leucocoprinus birnbaumii]|uniref:Uncharacterized protein n=1 Tax=Leucocoprinus birnbaumii TaxID=56174 RepID=A0AAD5W2H3_9AGAR|nr:hypothetical protein NP233_g3791 [Leucocoprinus birnbaumii]